MTFSVRVYRVNGLIELPVEAETKEAALAQACDTVARGIRIQPDGRGPLVYFRDARELLCVGVVAGDELPWRHDAVSIGSIGSVGSVESDPTDPTDSTDPRDHLQSQPSPYSE